MRSAGLLVLLAACQLSTSSSGGAGPRYGGGGGGDDRASGASTGHTVTVPDLFQMTRPEAEAAIRAAGITGPLEENTQGGSCDSAVEHEGGRPGEKVVVERGHVCRQAPAAGQQTSSTLFVTVTLQNEDPWKGDLGNGRHWALMPNVVGMTVAEAKAKLAAAGFGGAEINVSNAGGCAAGHVCRQYPEALTRTETTSQKNLFVGD